MTVALVAAAIAVVTAGALALRAVHEHVRDSRVRTHIARGDAFAARGELQPAAAQYRAALQLERDDPAAARSLALTLLRMGRLNESESYLRDLLRHDPTDGLLNRGLARVHVARGREADARAAYQRAIYGQWAGDSMRERTETRFELVEYLTRLGADGEVLAELLRLRAELPAGRTVEARRTADLLARHGAGELAIEMLVAAAAARPRDVDLLAQLADQQLAAGRTREARATLQRAVAIDGREDLRRRVRVVDRVLMLDPTLPRLGIVARTRRARLLLNAVLTHTSDCADDSPALAALRREAATAGRRSADAERAERELTLAAEIWSGAPACHTDTPETRAIAEVLEHVKEAGTATP